MPRVRDLLYRFRPAGAPGAAAAAGVPVDRTAELTAELEPLFAELARAERECTDIRERARADAAVILAREVRRARDLIAAAEARMASERAAATAAAQLHVERQTADLLAAAELEAAAVRQHATSHMTEYLAQAVARVREMLGEAADPRAGAAGS